jgi:hypothetical protein
MVNFAMVDNLRNRLTWQIEICDEHRHQAFLNPDWIKEYVEESL